MLRYNFSTFVLQRRINRPFDLVSQIVANPAIFGAGCVISSSSEGAIRLDSVFRCVNTAVSSVLRADASLLNERGKRVGSVEVELSPWSATTDSELVIRPAVAHPERWTGPRARRYFAHAHQSADGLTALLAVSPGRAEADVDDERHAQLRH